MKNLKKNNSFRLSRIFIPVLGLFWLLVTALPFIFIVFTSFKTLADSYSIPVWAPPETFSFHNYIKVLEGSFLIYLRNSVFVVFISVVIIVLISSMAAYALARIKFPLNNFLFSLIVAGMVVPLHVTLVPIYLMTRSMGLYDTSFALLAPYVAISLPLSIFILTEFMRQIPRELEEAAILDGCGHYKIFARIFFPLSRPGIFTVAIYNAIMLWNEFVFAYVLISSSEKRTLPLAVWDFQGQYAADIPAMLAVVTLSILPLIIVYAIGQEKIINGMMAGSLKG